MNEKLERLSQRLREEQRRLLLEAAELPALPSHSTLERVARLELNIAAIENTLSEAREGGAASR